MAPKVIIVTGASRGIGFAVATYLLKASHNLVLVSRSESELQQLKKQFPSQVEYLAADLTVDENAAKAAQLALKAFGKIDGVVINHGVLSPITRLEDASIEDWKTLYDANVFSALALTKEVIPHLRASKGRIIFTSSGAASNAYTAWGAYGSSKAALNSLARHIAVEESDITAVAVSPGRVDTAMQKELREKGSSAMAAKDYAGFATAFEEGKLNKPEWPGHVIAELSLAAKPELSGKYYTWNAPELAEYREG
ncbi:hypothetical protein B0T22DRAFT_105372 [Podospora appendiculata]|uniref:Ketoreductase domain-containing protein n=1 Tax=Podospora appendiculata TaxID=314037 RepID=A0AAE0XLA3_9PEZI|nr:hypothetical protein B0T22DRAFT_105372 [Podospora appendiculata]